MRVCSAHIVVFLIARVGKFLEFVNNQIITALAVRRFAQIVVHTLSAVKRQNNIAHFLVAKSITSLSTSTPFVVSVNLKFLSNFFSCSLPYCTSFLHTSQLSSGSPPKSQPQGCALFRCFQSKSQAPFCRPQNSSAPCRHHRIHPCRQSSIRS